MTASIHVLGVVVLDAHYRLPYLPGHDQKVFARSVTRLPGGPAAFMARAAARLGADVVLETAVGADAIGDRLIAAFEADGIRTDAVVRLGDEETPTVMILVDDSGEKAIILTPISADLLVQYGARSHFLPGATMVTHLFHPETVRLAAERIRAIGGRSLIDLEWPEIDRWGWEEALRCCAQIDVICTNSQLLAARMGRADVAAAANLARELAAGRLAACVTLGDKGIVMAAGGSVTHWPALPVKPTNTTGAGDTFIATVAAALSAGYDITTAAGMANLAAGWFLVGKPLELAGLAAAAPQLAASSLEAAL